MTLLRRDIIRDKALLRELYCEWYDRLLASLSKTDDVLELGSGAGFFKEFLPSVITSEDFETPGVRVVADACSLPLLNQSLTAIVMTDVFHHITYVGQFLHEAARCIRPGGKIVMIEPWRTPWSEWIYTHLHSEPFLPASGWKIPKSGPLSGANGASPWIVFQRDRAIFEAEHPEWCVRKIEPMMPISYLVWRGLHA